MLRVVDLTQALARLSHPNVVTVHEVGHSKDGSVFVAMEFVHGQSLGTWQRTKPTAQAVLAAYGQAGQGLVAAHTAGLVHRDFKPHNVMRTDDGGVKVLDFGLARQTGQPSSESETISHHPGRASLSSPLMLTSTVAGTPPYMSPSSTKGKPSMSAAISTGSASRYGRR